MMGRVSILATLTDPLRRAREALQGAGDVKAAMRERLDDYERVVNQFESKLGSISDRRIEPEVTKLLVHFDEITALVRKYTASPGNSLLVRVRKKTDRARLHKELAEELERIDKDMQRQLATIQVLGMMELSNPLPTFSLDVGNAASHDGGFTWHNLNWWMLLLLVVLVPIALSVCWKYGGGGSSTRPPGPDVAAAPAADTAAAPAVPLALPASYVERNSLISEVVGNLTAANAPRSPYVLQGSAGVGKTVLASALVRNEEVRKRFGRGIFWFDVGHHGNLKLPALVQRLAREMDVVSENMGGLDDCVRDIAFAVARDNSVPRLLVLDDVWHEEVVDALRPTGLQILVTTRLASVGRGMIVGDMEDGEARELLRKKSGAVALPAPEANQVRCLVRHESSKLRFLLFAGHSSNDYESPLTNHNFLNRETGCIPARNVCITGCPGLRMPSTDPRDSGVAQVRQGSARLRPGVARASLRDRENQAKSSGPPDGH